MINLVRYDEGPGYYAKRIVATKGGKPIRAHINVRVSGLWTYKGYSPLKIMFHPPCFMKGNMVDKGLAPSPVYGGTVEPGAIVKTFSAYLPWADTKDYLVDFVLAPVPTIGTLKVRAFEGSASPKELIRKVVVQGAGTAQFSAPFTVNLRVGTYVLTAYYKKQTQTKSVVIDGGITKTVDFNF